eukprot:6657083-Pyramimonas_sp.AAC.1
MGRRVAEAHPGVACRGGVHKCNAARRFVKNFNDVRRGGKSYDLQRADILYLNGIGQISDVLMREYPGADPTD